MTIENQVIEFNITDAAIADLKNQYSFLTITDINDKAGYQLVHAARMDVKSKRVSVEKRRKDLLTDALKYQRSINAEAARITDLLTPLETYLEQQERAYEAEKERIKKEKEDADRAAFAMRVDALKCLGVYFDGATFNNQTNIFLHLEHVKCMPDPEFIFLIEKARIEFDRKAELFVQKVLKDEAERDRIEKERAELAAERARLEAIAKEQAEREAALKKQEEAQKPVIEEPCNIINLPEKIHVNVEPLGESTPTVRRVYTFTQETISKYDGRLTPTGVNTVLEILQDKIDDIMEGSIKIIIEEVLNDTNVSSSNFDTGDTDSSTMQEFA